MVAAIVKDELNLNLSELSWGDTKACMVAGAKIQESNNDVTTILEAFKVIESVASTVIVSIPRAWLVSKAPTDIDFTKPDAVNWLKRDCFLRLLNQIINGVQEVDEDSKN